MKTSHISLIEQAAIDKVRELRKRRGISQAKLAYMIDVSPSFIGSVENPKERAKYNLTLLNRIAEAMECRIWDLVPEWPVGE